MHGYTFDEGRELVRDKQMINQVLDYKVRGDSRMIVKKEDAMTYYKDHPEVEEATFTLTVAYAPFSQYPQQKLDALLKKNKTPSDLVWDEPFTLKESELAEDRKFIVHEKVSRIVHVETLPDGYELTKLIEKTPAKQVPFEDCYNAIVSQMRKERFGKVLADYQHDLLQRAHVRFLREDLKF